MRFRLVPGTGDGGTYVSVHEVTGKQWAEVMGGPTVDRVSNYPVGSATWEDAINFCNALSIREGLSPVYQRRDAEVVWDRSARGCRLLTDAEWTLAASGPSNAPFFWGEEPHLACRHANFKPELRKSWMRFQPDPWPCLNGSSGIKQVGSYEPNAHGLHDTAGNMWEWVWDAYDSLPDASPGGTPARGGSRTIRGGSFNSHVEKLKLNVREPAPPSSKESDIGFRVTCPRKP